jgi:hypothetical protein
MPVVLLDKLRIDLYIYKLFGKNAMTYTVQNLTSGSTACDCMAKCACNACYCCCANKWVMN